MHSGLKCLGATVIVASLGVASVGHAGGFAVREQSTTSQGMSFAGSAANDTLSAMYWNPAAVANQEGMNSENHAAGIFANSELTVTGGTVLAGANAGNSGADSGNIAKPALVSAGYLNYQLSNIDPKLFVGLSTNAPFGLVTEPENENYAGSIIGRTSKVFNIVGTPTVGYKVAPWLTLAAGVQIAYLDATFKFGPANTASSYYNGDDYGFGWTVGAMLEPVKGTKIGIGFKSQVTYDLEGELANNATGSGFAADAQLTTPDILTTVSLQQKITDRMRFMATYEWTDWSDFDQVDIVAKQSGSTVAQTLGASVAGQTYATLDANWRDGWFVSAGLEFDYSKALTFRGGVAYKKSPIREASQRLTAVPDNDRIWLSAGLSYMAGQILPSLFGLKSTTTIDLAFTHILVDDGRFERSSVASNPALGALGTITSEGDTESHVNIVSFALRSKF